MAHSLWNEEGNETIEFDVRNYDAFIHWWYKVRVHSTTPLVLVDLICLWSSYCDWVNIGNRARLKKIGNDSTQFSNCFIEYYYILEINSCINHSSSYEFTHHLCSNELLLASIETIIRQFIVQKLLYTEFY